MENAECGQQSAAHARQFQRHYPFDSPAAKIVLLLQPAPPAPVLRTVLSMRMARYPRQYAQECHDEVFVREKRWRVCSGNIFSARQLRASPSYILRAYGGGSVI